MAASLCSSVSLPLTSTASGIADERLIAGIHNIGTRFNAVANRITAGLLALLQCLRFDRKEKSTGRRLNLDALLVHVQRRQDESFVAVSEIRRLADHD